MSDAEICRLLVFRLDRRRRRYPDRRRVRRFDCRLDLQRIINTWSSPKKDPSNLFFNAFFHHTDCLLPTPTAMIRRIVAFALLGLTAVRAWSPYPALYSYGFVQPLAPLINVEFTANIMQVRRRITVVRNVPMTSRRAH